MIKSPQAREKEKEIFTSGLTDTEQRIDKLEFAIDEIKRSLKRFVNLKNPSKSIEKMM